MPTIVPADNIRIAIALSALKLKPAALTINAYIIDLYAIFPLVESSRSHTTEVEWRDLAHTLERDLVQLKRKRDDDQNELIRLRAFSQFGSDATTTQPISPPSKQKKKKKTSTQYYLSSHEIHSLQSELNRIKDNPQIPVLPCPASLLSVHRALREIIQFQDHDRPSSAVAAVGKQATEALAAFLQSLISPDLLSPASLDLFPIMSALSSDLLVCLVPSMATAKNNSKSMVTRRSEIERFLGIFTTSILLPLIQSFGRLSHTFITAHISKPKNYADNHSGSIIDIRKHLLQLLQTLLCVLDKLLHHFEANSNHCGPIQCISHVKQRLALEVVRELEKMYSRWTPHIPCTPQAGSATSKISLHSRLDGRLSALAIKDAVWYLCTVLHLVVTPPYIASSAQGEDGLLIEAILGSLYDLVGNQHAAVGISGRVNLWRPGCRREGDCRSVEVLEDRSNFAQTAVFMDPLCGNMILAEIEKAWFHWSML